MLLLGAYLGTHISPNTFVYFAFLGLAYPWLILIELVFGAIWVFVKWRYALITVTVILVGFNHLRDFYSLFSFQDDIENPVKVLSYNVQVFDVYNFNEREHKRDEIFHFLDEQDADILCFQEFYHQENSSDFVTKDSMVKMLGTSYDHERYTHALTQKRYFGVATFSKYPIVGRGEIDFENDDNNSCIYSDILINEDTIRVFNAHLGSIRFQNDDYEFFGEEADTRYQYRNKAGRRILGRLKIAFQKRAEQSELVAAEIERSPYPVILCGDLNDTPVSYCYRQFSSILEDAFSYSGEGTGETYIGKVPSNRIDYIFHSSDLMVGAFTTHEIEMSDHKPISAEFGLK